MGTLKRQRSLLGLFKPRLLRVLMSLGVKGYLVDTGWIDAFITRSSVDKNGKSIPWTTYAFFDFFRERLHNQLVVFEYGSGHSTLFFGSAVAKVVAVEHNQQWYDRISKMVPDNVQTIYCPEREGGEYSKTSTQQGQLFNIIVIDGVDRVNCCKYAINAITDDGVIILDDSEREAYAEGIAFLKTAGFKQIRFTGMAPGVILRKETSVFYRAINCLDI